MIGRAIATTALFLESYSSFNCTARTVRKGETDNDHCHRYLRGWP